MQPTDESHVGVMPGVIASGRWQPVLTVAAAIAVVNCVVTGAIAAITVDLVLGPPLAVTIPVAIVATVVAVTGHYMFQRRAWKRADAMVSGPTAGTPPTPE